MKLHLIWDMDGTLVNSEPEILSTIEKSLVKVGVSLADASSKLRIGPPVREVIRNAFSDEVLSEEKLDEAVKAFRVIYDTSDYEDTKPFAGIDELIHDSQYIHHVITNKPFLATSRILEVKGWKGSIVEVITPDIFVTETGKRMTKQEMFQYFHSKNSDIKAVGIGDMATDAQSAHKAGMPGVGVLWGTGTERELSEAGCEAIVRNVPELINELKRFV